MPRKRKEVDYGEMLGSFITSLRTTSIKPTIYGYQPMPKQLDFHKSQARGRLFLGGNRSGKTVGGACETVMWMRGEHPYRSLNCRPPTRMRACAVDIQDGINKIMLPEVAKWVPPSSLIKGSWEASYDKMSRTLTLENGSFLEFMSYEQTLEKFAGTSRNGIWFDEEPPKDIFNENMARLIDTGGHWWMTMTPVEGMTWVYDDIYIAARTNPNFYVVEVQMDENVYLSPVEIEAALATMDDEEKEARRKGKFLAMGGLIYPMFGPANILPDIRDSEQWATIHDKWQFILGMDHGFNNPTAWLWCAISPDERIVIFDEHYERGKIVKYHAQAVIDKTRSLGISPEYFVGDPSVRNTDPITGTSVQLEYTEQGVPIMLGNNDVHAGINCVARMFQEHNLMITANCENLLREVGRYRWAKWATHKMSQTRNLKEDPVKKDDHAMDALRYIVASRPIFIEELEREVENRFHSSEAIDPEKPRIDMELLKPRQMGEYAEISDTYLGGEY